MTSREQVGFAYWTQDTARCATHAMSREDLLEAMPEHLRCELPGMEEQVRGAGPGHNRAWRWHGKGSPIRYGVSWGLRF